jgi:beta-lactamase class A
MNKRDNKKILKIFNSKKDLIIFLLSALLIIFVYLFFFKQKTINLSYNPFPFIDPLRSSIEQKHFFTTIEPLRDDLREIVKKYESEGVKMGVYFEYLNTGANISINDESRFWPASLSKMPTALVAMKKIEKGEWELENQLIMYYEDRNDDFGDLYKNEVGTAFTIKELLRELIVNSDDTAHRILIRNMTGQDFEEMLSALGMEKLYNENYDITAREYSRIFRSLYTSSFLSRENSTFLLELLASTRFNEFLDSGIPEDVLFSHKIGEHDPQSTYLDAGIVYVPYRPYLLTVMVNTDREKAKKIMKEISEASYKYVSNY